MDWIISRINKSIWSFISDLATQAMNSSLDRVIKYLETFDNVNRFFNFKDTLIPSIQALAIAYAAYLVAKNVVNMLSGGAIKEFNFTLSQFIVRILYAVGMIFFLPWSFNNLMLPFKNAIILGISKFSSTFKLGTNSDFIINFNELLEAGIMVILAHLIAGIAFFVLSIVVVFMYWELVIAYIASPLIAASAIENNEKLTSWFNETVAILATQVMYVLLLKLLTASFSTFQGFFDDLVMKNISIAAMIFIMLKGPSVVKKYLYSSGLGAQSTNAAGSIIRMIAMKKMIK